MNTDLFWAEVFVKPELWSDIDDSSLYDDYDEAMAFIDRKAQYFHECGFNSIRYSYGRQGDFPTADNVVWIPE